MKAKTLLNSTHTHTPSLGSSADEWRHHAQHVKGFAECEANESHFGTERSKKGKKGEREK